MRFHDFFAGIGGSSTGLLYAGLEGVVALNHWDYAIKLHNENHPYMDHDQADIWKADPRRYRPAEVGWFSPECRAHSQAKGKSRYGEHYTTDLWRNPTTDPADDRSRLLMESVPHISALAGYRYVLVENVVEVVKWVHFDRWLKEMQSLDYEWQLLFLNSQFFGTPQSRDRFFAVFWKRGEKAPNLDFHPPALCSKCGWVNGLQAWKPGRWYGKYGQQYTYICPRCSQQVEPEINGAYTVIDWAQPMPRIGDRPRGLSQLTLKKIEYGLKKFGQTAVVIDTAYSDSNKVRPVNSPLFTQTRQQSLALTVSYYGRENAVKSAVEPLMTVPTENKIGVALLIGHYSRETAVTDANEPLRAVVSGGKTGLAYIETLRKDTLPTALDCAMPTVISGGNQHALVMANYGSNPVFAPVDEPVPTVTTVLRHSLIEPDVDLNDVRFRMLKPRELASGTGFPGTYILNGSQKNQVKGIGGAVDPNVAAWLGKQIVEAIE